MEQSQDSPTEQSHRRNGSDMLVNASFSSSRLDGHTIWSKCVRGLVETAMARRCLGTVKAEWTVECHPSRQQTHSFFRVNMEFDFSFLRSWALHALAQRARGGQSSDLRPRHAAAASSETLYS